VLQYSRNLNKRCGFFDWERFTNHSWRQYAITKLVNDPTVNPAETLRFARHASITSQVPYNRPGEHARSTFQRALAHKPLPVKRAKGGGRKSTKKAAAKSTTKEKIIKKAPPKRRLRSFIRSGAAKVSVELRSSKRIAKRKFKANQRWETVMDASCE
jgi:hypothetical protein